MKKLLILLACISLFNTSYIQGQNDTLKTTILQPDQMKADFEWLCNVLKETHPGLYRYTSHHQITATMNRLASSFTEPMPFYQFYQHISELIAQVRCAHTNVWAQKNVGDYYENQIKTFPFQILTLGNRYFIGLNGTLLENAQPGDELLAINGQTMAEIRDIILKYFSTDGYIQSSETRALSERLFPFFHYSWVSQSDTFEVQLKDLQGNLKTVEVLAQTLTQTNQNMMKNPVNADILKIYLPKSELNQKKSWRIEFLEEPGTALLTIRNFNKGNGDASAKREIRKFLKNCALQIKAHKTRHLIIDLRDNGGGWDIQGLELFRFLIQKPAYYYQHKHAATRDSEYLRFSGASPKQIQKATKTLQAEDDGTFTIKVADDESLELLEPYSEPFKGKVYILMNANTGSAAAEFTAMAQSNDLAVCIGDETGGAYEGSNSGTFLNFDLPNSKIHVRIPLIYYQNAVKESNQKGRGTIPDYPVQRSIEDIMNGVDRELEFALNLIKQGS